MNLLFSHQTLGDRVMQITDLAALLEAVRDNFGRSHQGRINLLFLFAVGADGGNESSGRDIFLSHEEFARRCAGDANIALPNCATDIIHGFDLKFQFGR